MKTSLIASAVLALAAAAPMAQAHEQTFNVVTTWFEPDTQPRNTIFRGSFDFDEHTGAVLNLRGELSESMTGDPADLSTMTWLTLSNQLFTQHDVTLGGTLVAVFKNSNTNTFFGNTWTPTAGIAGGGVYAGFPVAGNNSGNAYALIFVPNNPTAALTQDQIDLLAYADCAPGGMMGASCMTGTSLAGYGAIGTMGGTPLSQSITAAVPEPGTYALMLGGLALVAGLARRRKNQA